MFVVNQIFLIGMPEGSNYIVKGIILILIILYFVPSIIARKTNSIFGIFLLNLLLGWTFLGWIGALIWAISSNNNRRTEIRHNDLIDIISQNQNSSQIFNKDGNN